MSGKAKFLTAEPILGLTLTDRTAPWSPEATLICGGYLDGADGDGRAFVSTFNFSLRGEFLV